MTTDAYREDTVRSGTTLREVLRRLWPFIVRQKALALTTIVAVLALAGAARLGVTLFGMAIDEGLLKRDRDFIVMVALAYFLIEFGRMFMAFLHAYLFARIGNRILFEVRDQLIRHVQSLPISYFDRHPSGRIVTRLTNDVVSLGELFTQGLITVFASFVSLAAIVIAMATISVKMTAFTLLIAPPVIWIGAILSRKLLDAQRESKAQLAAINAFVAENIGGMRVLQLYGRLKRNSERFASLSANYRAKQIRITSLYALLWPATSFFNAASVGIALYAGGRFTIDGAISTGAMVAFILHVRAFIDPLNVILEKYQIFQNALSGAERIFTLLDEPPEDTPVSTPIAASAPFARQASQPTRFSGEIEFKNTSFRYRSELPLALDGIQLSIRAGESVAFVGRTGSGKSTMIALLQRLYEPTAGAIFIDGFPITSISRRELRSRIGVVQQDTFMFRGSIAENIHLRSEAIDAKKVEAAAEGACLTEFLKRQNEGLDRKVEERGANLSFGERQLVAFARILAFDPDILILDEATANIDSQTEQLIQEATQKVRQGRTSLIVAHRISTILDCDRIVVLDQGRIIEQGSHHLLYNAGGMYRQLCDAQFAKDQLEESLEKLDVVPAKPSAV
jgi:ATP-binding cassette subfamily B multidrug efflux pump